MSSFTWLASHIVFFLFCFVFVLKGHYPAYGKGKMQGRLGKNSSFYLSLNRHPYTTHLCSPFHLPKVRKILFILKYFLDT